MKVDKNLFTLRRMLNQYNWDKFKANNRLCQNRQLQRDKCSWVRKKVKHYAWKGIKQDVKTFFCIK